MVQEATKAATRFDPAEYAGRIARTKRRMEEVGLDLLLLSDPSNIYYLSGYDAWSFYVGQALLVALDAEQPIWIGREMDANAARLTAVLPEEHLVGYDDAYVQAADRHWTQVVADVVRGHGWQRRRLGVELASYYLGARTYHELCRALPDAAIADASLLVNWLRVVKSPAELTCMREAARIVERAMGAGLAAIAPGVRGCDAAAAVYHAQISGTEAFGGQYTSSPPFMPSGERTGAPHLTWTDEPYRRGQPITLELVACRHRYHTPLGRTVVLGTPPPGIAATAEVVVEGLTAALDAVRPGRTCQEVEAVWRRTVARHGIEKRSRLGYSIGIAYPPTFGESTLSLRPGDETVLEPNMTLHMIPGIWQNGWGVLITEPFRVTETGHEPLCSLPRQLVVKA